MRPPLRDDEAPDPLAAVCDHKFVDSNVCLKCGWEAPAAATSAEPDPPAATEPAASAPNDLLEILDPIPATDPVANPFGLSPRELLFVEAYVGVALGRAAKAYELAGYKVTGASHRANASRMLTRPRVEAAIAARLGDRVERLRIMDGDEALEGISNLGRVGIKAVCTDLAWVQALPDEVADAIKSITPTKHGYRIEMYDKLHARETMAKVHGKLKDVVKVEHSLEDIMARANQLEQSA